MPKCSRQAHDAPPRPGHARCVTGGKRTRTNAWTLSPNAGWVPLRGRVWRFTDRRLTSAPWGLLPATHLYGEADVPSERDAWTPLGLRLRIERELRGSSEYLLDDDPCFEASKRSPDAEVKATTKRVVRSLMFRVVEAWEVRSSPH